MEVSRRSFIGGAAVAGLTMGVSALTGCSAQSSSSSTSESSEESSEFSFLTKPDEYTSWDEELSADVVVVGQGLAGVCAARKALEDGATVITIEQATEPLYRSAQFGVINSEYQKSVGHEFSDEEIGKLINTLMRDFGGRVDEGIWRRWAKDSGAIFDWMISTVPEAIQIDPRKNAKENKDEYNFRFDMETEVLTDWDGNETDSCAVCINNWPGNPDINNDDEMYPCWEGPCELLPNQTPWMNAVMESFEASENITQYFSTWGRQLIVDDSGAVIGVFAEDIEGKIYKITSEKSVVVAPGGDLATEDMVNHYLPELSLFPNCVWYQTDANGEMSHNGSGILMGYWAGGAIDDNPHAFILHGFGGGLGQDPFLLLDKNGNRFMNENIGPNLISQRAGHAPDGYIWQIFDDNYADQVGVMQSGHAGYWKIVEDLDDVPWGNFMEGAGMTTREAVEAGSDYVCDTIEEIAENTGMPLEALQASIDRYNELAEAGFDADFGKDASRLFPLNTPPYYVKQFKANGSGMEAETVFTSLNGLKSNSEAQVLDASGNAIPNLYCCGNCQGSRFAFDYPVTYMGVSHGMAMTYGYIAGMNAAANA